METDRIELDSDLSAPWLPDWETTIHNDNTIIIIIIAILIIIISSSSINITETGKQVLRRTSKSKLPHGLRVWPDEEGAQCPALP